MNDLSEIAMRVLAELEEAYAENVTSTMNTVLALRGDASEISEISNSLRELVLEGLVRIAYANAETGKLSIVSKAQSLADVEELSRRVSFKATDQLWIWDKAFPRAQIMTTQSGLIRARQILEQRGYQWWVKSP